MFGSYGAIRVFGVRLTGRPPVPVRMEAAMIIDNAMLRRSNTLLKKQSYVPLAP